MDLVALLRQMIAAEASDIFFIAGLPLSYQAGGRQVRLGEQPLTPPDTKQLVQEVYRIADRDPRVLMDNNNHDDDFSFSLPGTGRFRVNVFRQRGSYAAVIRIIPFGLPDFEKIGIPPEVMALSKLNKGLVLVTGPAGAGKSTTLACIIDRLNHDRTGHIITMEDPIEYVHRHDNCIVTQREIPTDVATYGEALRSAMREAPDVILLGEMRDSDTISIAITAAEMAQLIFSTLHTNSASDTVDRIVDSFPPSQQRQVRLSLSMVLRAVVSQKLVPTIDGGVVPAFEIMVVNTAIQNLIREEKTYQINSVIASSRKDGMRTMNQSLFDLVKTGVVSRDVAIAHSPHPDALENRFANEGL